MRNCFLNENPKLLKAFKEFLLREKKNKVSSPYYSGEYKREYECWTSFLELRKIIIFYEWSKVDGSKLTFKNVQEFYDFLLQSKISLPDYQMKEIMIKNDILHFTCMPNKAKLIIGATKDELETDLNKLQKLEKR